MFLKRRGFTLVELLIVIIVIGILAGGMMLTLISASDSARASAMVSELRNAKAAGIFWFANNVSSKDAEHVMAWDRVTMRQAFNDNKYLDNPEKVNEFEFALTNLAGDGVVYLIGVEVDRKTLKKALRQTKGILLSGTGLPATINDTIVYIRVK